MNENIIDYGSWYCPSSWNELTLKQFQDIEQYYSDKEKKVDVREVLHLLTDHSIDEIGQLPIEFVNKLLERLIWLQEAPKWDDPTNKVEIDGEIYQVNFQEKLKFGEYAAVSMAIKGDKHNYAAMMAILCRKEGEKYDLKFENETLPSRIQFWENQPITKVMPIVSFFLTLWLMLRVPTQLYSEVEEELNNIQQLIENSEKLGRIKKLSMKWQMKKLRKSLKSMKLT